MSLQEQGRASHLLLHDSTRKPTLSKKGILKCALGRLRAVKTCTQQIDPLPPRRSCTHAQHQEHQTPAASTEESPNEAISGLRKAPFDGLKLNQPSIQSAGACHLHTSYRSRKDTAWAAIRTGVQGGAKMGRLTTCPDCEASVSKTAVTCPQCGRPLRGRQFGCPSKVLMIGAASVIGAIWISANKYQRFRQQVNPELGVAQSDSPSATPSIPIVSKFRPGDEVELIGPKEMRMPRLYATEAILWAYRSNTREFVLGEEIFGVSPGDLANVLVDKGDRLQVKVLNGSWKDRIGWIESDEVRLSPTLKDALRDVVDGLTLVERRTIYGDLYRVGMQATFESEHRAPISNLPGSLARHQAVYNALEKEGRESLIAKYRRYGIDRADLERIDNEGVQKRWPLPDAVNPFRN